MIPSAESIASLLDQIRGTLHETELTAEDDFLMSQTMLEAAFDGLNKSEWKSRLGPDGSGAELIANIPHLSARHLASWWILEEGYDKICIFLNDNFGSFVLRERQLSKIRVEISAYEDNDSNKPRRKLGAMFEAVEKYKDYLTIQVWYNMTCIIYTKYYAV